MSFLSDRANKIPPSGIRVFFDLVLSSKGIISLGVGEPDFLTPWNIRDEALTRYGTVPTRADVVATFYIRSQSHRSCGRHIKACRNSH